MQQLTNDTERGEPEDWEKGRPAATTNPTWAVLGVTPGLHGDRPETNRLSYSTACHISSIWNNQVPPNVGCLPWAPISRSPGFRAPTNDFSG